MELPQKAEKLLKRLEKLDLKQIEISNTIDAIYKTSPVGQAPPCFHRAVDKLCVVAKKKAPIWNYIRHYIIPGTHKTIWQGALESRNIAVGHWGKEEGTCITANEIRILIAKEQEQQITY